MQLPFVHGMAHRGAEFAVLETLPVVAGGIQNAQHAVIGVQQLLPQERQRRARPATGRPRIAARRIRLALRIRRTRLIRLPGPRAEHLHMLDPALLQIRMQRLVAGPLRMDVAVGGRQLRPVRGLRQRGRGHLDVHHAISLTGHRLSTGMRPRPHSQYHHAHDNEQRNRPIATPPDPVRKNISRRPSMSQTR